MERKLATIEKKTNCGDIFDYIFPIGTTEEQAIKESKNDWKNLSDKDRFTTIVECAWVDVDEEGLIDYGTGYTPIWSSEDPIEQKIFKLKLISKRDVDHIVEIEAADRDEAYKIGYGITFGRGFPDDVEIIE